MSNLKLKVVATVAALAMGSTAMANTTLEASTTGDLFLNVVDTVSGTSFLFDTGISQASFNGNGTYSFNLGTNAQSSANWAAFVSASGSDALQYSVLSAAQPTGTSDTVMFTANSAPSAVVGSNIAQAQAGIGGFLSGANNTATTSTNSVNLAGGASWADGLNGGLVSTNLMGVATGLGATPGTALAFYSETSSNLRSNTIAATLNAFAGSWNLNGATLTYSAVPLPMPLVLLLSGLGLMAVVSRRRKADAMGYAAAAV